MQKEPHGYLHNLSSVHESRSVHQKGPEIKLYRVLHSYYTQLPSHGLQGIIVFF